MPTVDVVPTIYCLTSDSAMALITGRGRTLRKYTLAKDLAASKAEMIVEIGHEMLWGKDRQTLVKANVGMIDQGLDEQAPAVRLSDLDHLCGRNKLCGDRGIEPLDQWGQGDPKGFQPASGSSKGQLGVVEQSAERTWC